MEIEKLPEPHWFWGQTKDFAKSTIGFVENCIQENKEIVSTKIAFRNFHILLHPDPIKEALVKKNKSFVKSFAYSDLSDFLGKGLLTNEGEGWLSKRRNIQPCFSAKSIASLTDLIDKLIKEVRTKEFGELHSDSYLDQVVNEGLRIYPPAWAISREAVEDIEILGKKISKGDTLFLFMPCIDMNRIGKTLMILNQKGLKEEKL